MCGDMSDRITWRMKVDPTLLVVTIAHYSTCACSHTELATIPKAQCMELTAAYPRAYRAFTQERHSFGKCIGILSPHIDSGGGYRRVLALDRKHDA